jgi:hypothetical protein
MFSGVITSSGSRQFFSVYPAGFIVGVAVSVCVAVREGVVDGVTGVGKGSGMLVSVFVPAGVPIAAGVSPPRQEAKGRISNTGNRNRRATVFPFIRPSRNYLPDRRGPG